MGGEHPLWTILREHLSVLCATVSLVVMLVFNYNGVDHRDAETTLVVAISTACGVVAAKKFLTPKPDRDVEDKGTDNE